MIPEEAPKNAKLRAAIVSERSMRNKVPEEATINALRVTSFFKRWLLSTNIFRVRMLSTSGWRLSTK